MQTPKIPPLMQAIIGFFFVREFVKRRNECLLKFVKMMLFVIREFLYLYIRDFLFVNWQYHPPFFLHSWVSENLIIVRELVNRTPPGRSSLGEGYMVTWITNKKSQINHKPLRTRRTNWNNKTKKCGLKLNPFTNPFQKSIRYVCQIFDKVLQM